MVFTVRQWLERFRQFMQRDHKLDNTQLLKREVADSNWTRKKQTIQEAFNRGVEIILPDNQGRI